MSWKKGQTGNPNGRPANPVIQELADAIKTVEIKKKKSLLVHFAEQAYEDRNVLVALLKKRIPDLSAIDMQVDNPQMNEQLVKLRESLKAIISNVQNSRRRT